MCRIGALQNSSELFKAYITSQTDLHHATLHWIALCLFTLHNKLYHSVIVAMFNICSKCFWISPSNMLLVGSTGPKYNISKSFAVILSASQRWMNDNSLCFVVWKMGKFYRSSGSRHNPLNSCALRGQLAAISRIVTRASMVVDLGTKCHKSTKNFKSDTHWRQTQPLLWSNRGTLLE